MVDCYGPWLRDRLITLSDDCNVAFQSAADVNLADLVRAAGVTATGTGVVNTGRYPLCFHYNLFQQKFSFDVRFDCTWPNNSLITIRFLSLQGPVPRTQMLMSVTKMSLGSGKKKPPTTHSLE